MEMKVKKVCPTAQLPRRATEGSAGYDLSACIPEPVLLRPGQVVKFPTGIAIQIPGPDMVGLVFSRSSLGARYGITLANSVGVIDSDYRGEIQVPLRGGTEGYVIQPGERIAQLVLVPVFTPELRECEELDSSARGEKGFGSTGKL